MEEDDIQCTSLQDHKHVILNNPDDKTRSIHKCRALMRYIYKASHTGSQKVMVQEDEFQFILSGRTPNSHRINTDLMYH